METNYSTRKYIEDHLMSVWCLHRSNYMIFFKASIHYGWLLAFLQQASILTLVPRLFFLSPWHKFIMPCKSELKTQQCVGWSKWMTHGWLIICEQKGMTVLKNVTEVPVWEQWADMNRGEIPLLFPTTRSHGRSTWTTRFESSSCQVLQSGRRCQWEIRAGLLLKAREPESLPLRFIFWRAKTYRDYYYRYLTLDFSSKVDIYQEKKLQWFPKE